MTVDILVSYVRLHCFIVQNDHRVDFTKRVVGTGTPEAVTQDFIEAHSELTVESIIESRQMEPGQHFVIID